MSSSIAASVVVLPPPGPAATSTRPGPGASSSRVSAGSPSLSSAGTSGGIRRSEMPMPAALLRDVDALARPARGRQRHRHVAGPLQDLAPPVVEQRHRQAVQEVALERPDRLAALAGQRPQLAVDAQDRGEAGLEVDVRGAEAARRREGPIEEGVHGMTRQE